MFKVILILSLFTVSHCYNAIIDNSLTRYDIGNMEKYYERLQTNDDAKYLEEIAQNCSDNVFIIAGGSLASNTGANYVPNISYDILVWNQSLPGWEVASFPLAGGDGSGSSPWLEFGYHVFTQTQNPVCFINVARSNSHIKEWHPATGKYNSLLQNAYDLMSSYTSNGFVLWSQGESDANFRHYFSGYGSYLYDIVNQSPDNVKWFISQTSYSPWNQDEFEDNIRYDQQNVVLYTGLGNKAYAGPNTDSICQDDRYDNYYLTKNGVHKVSVGWIESYEHKSKTFSMGSKHCEVRYLTPAELLAITVYVFMMVMLFGACCMGCFFCANVKRYPQKVYHKTIMRGSPERKPLLNVNTI